MTQNSPCGCSSKARTAPPGQASRSIPKQRLTIEFMYLDREVCAPCQLTETALEAALAEASGLLETSGVEVSLRKIHIRSLEHALALGFSLSPTVRVNGVDIQLDSQESHCATCSALSGTSTQCREWLYQGQTYQAPPKAMLVDALLEAAGKSSGVSPSTAPVSDQARANLKRFFDAQREKQITARPLRDEPVKETACCAPALPDSAACGESQRASQCCGSLT